MTLHYPNFQLSDLEPTLATPLKPVILALLLSYLIVSPARGSDNKTCTVLINQEIWGKVSNLQQYHEDTHPVDQ